MYKIFFLYNFGSLYLNLQLPRMKRRMILDRFPETIIIIFCINFLPTGHIFCVCLKLTQVEKEPQIQLDIYLKNQFQTSIRLCLLIIMIPKNIFFFSFPPFLCCHLIKLHSYIVV